MFRQVSSNTQRRGSNRGFECTHLLRILQGGLVLLLSKEARRLIAVQNVVAAKDEAGDWGACRNEQEDSTQPSNKGKAYGRTVCVGYMRLRQRAVGELK